MAATIIPLKIYFPKRGFQIGVAAKSLQHLRDTLQAKMGLSSSFKLTLDDGTIVCDPEYFKLLERQTKLNVIEASLLSKKTTANATEATVARKRMSPSTPTEASKRARLSPESRDGDQKDLNTNQNNSQLLSKICISSVAGNVPMSVSPKSASEYPRPSTAVQQPKQLRNIAPQLQNIVPQPQAQPISPPPQLQCTQTQTIIRSPPPAQQVQNDQLSRQQLHRKPATAAPRQGQIMLSQHPHPQIQPSIPSPMILPRPRGPSYPHQIVFPSNQPHAFPGHPPMPLTAPPIMTPSTIQWIPQGAGRYPPQGVIPPSYQQGPRVLYPHPVPMSPPPHPDILAYQPGPPQQPTQERICQMQVERQMKTVIRMTPPPNPSQTPLPRPVQPPIRPAPVVPQTQPMAVIQSPVRGPIYPVQVQPAPRPSTALPDGTHIVQQVVELLQAPEPTLIPSTPPALLKVISSKLPTDSRYTSSTPNPPPPPPSTDLSNSTDASGLSAPTCVSDHSEPASIQGRQVTTPAEDTDCEDEHALQIVIGESENLPQPSTPPPPPPPAPRLSSSPCALSSPQSRASSSPCSSPVVAVTQKSRKPTELNLLSTQIDDGYCSATASSLGSADDVKRALPFASFDDYIPLHNCYADSKEDKQDNDAIESTVPQDKCAITNPKDDRTDEHEQRDVITQTTSSADFEDKTLIVEIPIKIVDGQIYYKNDSSVLVKEEPGVGRQEVKVESDLGRQDVQEEETDLGREEIIFLDSEADDNDSDVCPLDQYINQGTPSNNFHLSLDEETSEMDTDVESDRTVESSGEIDEKQVVVADHGGEVPVVTTPLDCTVAFKCVSDLMDIIGLKDKQNADSNIESPAQTTSAICNNGATCHFDGEANTCIVEESVLLDSSNLHDEGLLSDELVMGNEVVVSLEGSSQQAFDYMDSSELISNLLLHSCLPQNGRPVSLS